MSEVTADFIKRSRHGTTQTSAGETYARRRKMGIQLKRARHVLTSSSAQSPASLGSLVRCIAESALGLTPVAIVMILSVWICAQFWIASDFILIWALCALILLGGRWVLASRYLALILVGETEASIYRVLFFILQFCEGTSWAFGLLVLYQAPQPEAHDFAFVITVLMTVIIAMANLVMPISLGIGLAPIIVVVAWNMGDITESITNFVLLGGGCLCILFYVVVFGNANLCKLVASLSFQEEKDALIAELEQAKYNSDEACRRAEEANIAKSRFLATMSHELRTPLNAILGFSEVMKAELLGPHSNKTYGEYAGDIHSSGQHLLMLINEILDLSRVESGRYELKEEAVSLTGVVEECVHLLSLRARNKSIEMTQDIDGTLPRLWADERALRQIALNILSNAIKFTPQGGTVTVRVGQNKNHGQYLSIRDNGPGIPESEMNIVMSSFGRGSMAQKNAEEGSGLGLPIVRGLVELHGGEFTLKSKVREGTEVIVAFPPERVMDALASIDTNGRTETEMGARRAWLANRWRKVHAE